MVVQFGTPKAYIFKMNLRRCKRGQPDLWLAITPNTKKVKPRSIQSKPLTTKRVEADRLRSPGVGQREKKHDKN